MTHFLGSLAALTMIYIAASVITVNRAPSRAFGFLGLIAVGPSALFILAQTQGFIAGLLFTLMLVSMIIGSVRLLLGKRLFALLLAIPIISFAKTWFNRRELRKVKNIWDAKKKKM